MHDNYQIHASEQGRALDFHLGEGKRGGEGEFEKFYFKNIVTVRHNIFTGFVPHPAKVNFGCPPPCRQKMGK